MSLGFTEPESGALVCLPQGRCELLPRLSGECQCPAVPVRGIADLDLDLDLDPDLDPDHAIAAERLYAVLLLVTLMPGSFHKARHFVAFRTRIVTKHAVAKARCCQRAQVPTRPGC
jgi:hypothetical protein